MSHWFFFRPALSAGPPGSTWTRSMTRVTAAPSAVRMPSGAMRWTTEARRRSLVTLLYAHPCRPSGDRRIFIVGRTAASPPPHSTEMATTHSSAHPSRTR